MKEAYRAFEIGLRNCVAQGFVMTELQLTMACIIRQLTSLPLTKSGIDSIPDRAYVLTGVSGCTRPRGRGTSCGELSV